MPRRAWDNAESAANKATGWSRLGLRDRRPQLHNGCGPDTDHRATPQLDPIKKLMGEPGPGESALDRKKKSEIANTVEPFGIDWSKMSEIGRAHV